MPFQVTHCSQIMRAGTKEFQLDTTLLLLRRGVVTEDDIRQSNSIRAAEVEERYHANSKKAAPHHQVSVLGKRTAHTNVDE